MAESIPPMDPADKTILCAPDSFKGTMTAEEAAAAMSAGVRSVWPEAVVRELPLADGGEGSIDVLASAAGGERVSVMVEDPIGQPVTAHYLRLPDGSAVIEMAQASGLLLVSPDARNPMSASTFGTGQLILHAVTAGARQVIVCVGGSATTDGGAGMAEALGYRLLTERGRPVQRGGAGLVELDRIDSSGANAAALSAEVVVAADVQNRLYGPDGAAAVYGPQKGATPAQIEVLDAGLRQLAIVLARDRQIDVSNVAGGGAAGGLAAGLIGFLGATIQSGAEVMMDVMDVDRALAHSWICFSGEGRIDNQTSQGKLLARLVRRCERARVPFVAIGGSVEAGASIPGAAAIVSASLRTGPVPEASEARTRLLEATGSAVSLVRLGLGLRRGI